MLKLTDVSVSYGRVQALKSINMEVKEGELVVLLGANGSGKSTIFRTISGLNKPSNGAIYFKDKQVHGSSPNYMVSQGVIHCPEGRKLFPQMSIHENLVMGAYVIRKNKEEVKRNMEKVYEMFPILKEKRNDPAGSMSGGQQQMLAIGRSLMAKPKILLLDEPSLGLAPLVVQQMFDVIKEINSEGTTVLLAEQNANAALKVANRGYVIENGSIVLEDTSEALLANDEIRKAYIGA